MPVGVFQGFTLRAPNRGRAFLGYWPIFKGDLKYLPGVDMEFDTPESPEIKLDPRRNDTNVREITEYLSNNKIFPVN